MENKEHHIVKIGKYYRVQYRKYHIVKQLPTFELAVKYRDEIEQKIKEQNSNSLSDKINQKNVRKAYPNNVIDMLTECLTDKEMEEIDWFWVEENADKNIKYILSRVDAKSGELCYRWLNGETLETIGKSEGFTRERARQVVEKAINKITAMRRYILYTSEYNDYKVSERIYLEKKAEYDALIANLDADIRGMNPSKVYNNDVIETLDIPARAIHCLHSAGIKTVGELTQFSLEAIANIRSMGVSTLAAIQDALAKEGYSLKSEYRK